MAQVTIQKCKSAETIPQTLAARVQSFTDAIRQRAYDLFQSRNGFGGSDVEDWLRAERDVAWSPASELVEDDKEFRAKVALPGFDAKDIEVSVMPDALIVQAEATHSHEGKDASVRFCEFSEKSLFRRMELPATVDVDKVTASIDKGILQITAPKAVAKQITAAATA